MANVRPMRIPGRWREGYALDYHTLSSTYLGDDEYGHPMFDTKRSDVGELLYRLKYRSDRAVLDELVETAANFVRSWSPGVTILVPVPPSRARAEQPVRIIAEALGRTLGISVDPVGVARVKETPELKNVYAYDERLRLLEGAHRIEVSVVRGQPSPRRSMTRERPPTCTLWLSREPGAEYDQGFHRRVSTSLAAKR